MINPATNKPLRLVTGDQGWSYVVVPIAQLADVSAVLDTHGVPYEVDEWRISLDGNPEVTLVNFPQHTDPAPVQKLLDAIP